MADEITDLFVHLAESVRGLFDIVRIAGDRFINNLGQSVANLTLLKLIRLVAVVGAYLLIRPHVIKYGAKVQAKQFEVEAEKQTDAEIQPNDLRGVIPGDSDDEGEEEQPDAATTATQWGKKATKRQRATLKKLIEIEEKRLAELQEDEEDKDIEQYLTMP